MTLVNRRKLLPFRNGRPSDQPGHHQPEHPGAMPARPDRTALWLLAIICLEAAVALSIRLPLVLNHDPQVGDPGFTWVPDVLAVLVVPLLVLAAWLFVRQQHRERIQAFRTSRFMDMVLHTSREWLWATDTEGRFTFSGPACRDLTGYEPSELLGRHFSVVIDTGDLANTEEHFKTKEGFNSPWSGLVTVCRRRDGSRVLVEVSGRPALDREGRVCGFEGTSRAVDAGEARSLASEEAAARLRGILAKRQLSTAFQPIRSLDTGAVIGAEALT